jgi:hypothetical protein
MDITKTLKTAGELALKYREMDLYEQIIALREDIATLREENISLREQNKNLLDSISITPTLVRDGNCYYKDADSDHHHPFCLTCWDHDRKLISLHQTLGYSVGSDSPTPHIRCDICDSRKQ